MSSFAGFALRVERVARALRRVAITTGFAPSGALLGALDPDRCFTRELERVPGRAAAAATAARPDALAVATAVGAAAGASVFCF